MKACFLFVCIIEDFLLFGIVIVVVEHHLLFSTCRIHKRVLADAVPSKIEKKNKSQFELN
jgi:hypothetical protein